MKALFKLKVLRDMHMYTGLVDTDYTYPQSIEYKVCKLRQSVVRGIQLTLAKQDSLVNVSTVVGPEESNYHRVGRLHK